MMELLCDSEDVSLFETEAVKSFFEYQWTAYGSHLQYLGAFIHFCYLTLFVVYVN